MSNYRRAVIPGWVFFFTVVTCNRRPIFANAKNVDALRQAFRDIVQSRPFEIDAIVILPVAGCADAYFVLQGQMPLFSLDSFPVSR